MGRINEHLQEAPMIAPEARMEILLHDWLELLFRWLHVVTAIAWIGSSFYFIWLDNSLRDYGTLEPNADGENWSVHGGGFYHNQKFLVAPERMPEELHWFKWESYMTWISGFCLMVIVYYWGAESYLIDRSVMDISPAVAIAISVGSLALGWVIYDLLCRSPLKERGPLLFIILFAFIVLAAYGFGLVFSGRAAFLHVGVIIATMMSANVFLVIIPNQKKVVAALNAGETPDPALGKAAAQEFDNLASRTFSHYSWTARNDPRGTVMPDPSNRGLHFAMGQSTALGHLCHLYTKSQYSCLFMIVAAPAAAFGGS